MSQYGAATKVRQIPPPLRRRNGLLPPPSAQSPDAGPGEHIMDGEHDAELEAADTALQLEGISGEAVDNMPATW